MSRRRYRGADARRRHGVAGRAGPGARRARQRRTRRSFSARGAEATARARLGRFRQGSILAVGATALALLLVGDPAPAADTGIPDTGGALVVGQGTPTGETATPATEQEQAPAADTAPADPEESARRAAQTLRDLLRGFYALLPRLGIALALLLAAGVAARLVRIALRVLLASWERAEATAALVGILVWLLALGAALSILAGDPRALVGSVGLFGLALSWALQTPIESFTGWLMNSFRSYYRIGDRILVGDVFGDVARIDFLTTTVFEAGGPEKRVQAAQSTGALVTFPNYEVLRSNITNFTRDFPFVWDELTIGVANESDIPVAARVLQQTAEHVVGERMRAAAEEYAALLEQAHLGWDVATRPEVYASARESWTDLTIRYLVPAREMRVWSSRLLLAVNAALADPGVAERVHAGYPRSQIQRLPAPEWAPGEGKAP